MCLGKHGAGLSLPETSPPGTGSVSLAAGDCIGAGGDGRWGSGGERPLDLDFNQARRSGEGAGRAGGQGGEAPLGPTSGVGHLPA